MHTEFPKYTGDNDRSFSITAAGISNTHVDDEDPLGILRGSSSRQNDEATAPYAVREGMMAGESVAQASLEVDCKKRDPCEAIDEILRSSKDVRNRVFSRQAHVLEEYQMERRKLEQDLTLLPQTYAQYLAAREKAVLALRRRQQNATTAQSDASTHVSHPLNFHLSHGAGSSDRLLPASNSATNDTSIPLNIDKLGEPACFEEKSLLSTLEGVISVRGAGEYGTGEAQSCKGRIENYIKEAMGGYVSPLRLLRNGDEAVIEAGDIASRRAGRGMVNIMRSTGLRPTSGSRREGRRGHVSCKGMQEVASKGAESRALRRSKLWGRCMVFSLLEAARVQEQDMEKQAFKCSAAVSVEGKASRDEAFRELNNARARNARELKVLMEDYDPRPSKSRRKRNLEGLRQSLPWPHVSALGGSHNRGTGSRGVNGSLGTPRSEFGGYSSRSSTQGVRHTVSTRRKSFKRNYPRAAHEKECNREFPADSSAEGGRSFRDNGVGKGGVAYDSGGSVWGGGGSRGRSEGEGGGEDRCEAHSGSCPRPTSHYGCPHGEGPDRGEYEEISASAKETDHCGDGGRRSDDIHHRAQAGQDARAKFRTSDNESDVEHILGDRDCEGDDDSYSDDGEFSRLRRDTDGVDEDYAGEERRSGRGDGVGGDGDIHDDNDDDDSHNDEGGHPAVQGKGDTHNRNGSITGGGVDDDVLPIHAPNGSDPKALEESVTLIGERLAVGDDGQRRQRKKPTLPDPNAVIDAVLADPFNMDHIKDLPGLVGGLNRTLSTLVSEAGSYIDPAFPNLEFHRRIAMDRAGYFMPGYKPRVNSPGADAGAYWLARRQSYRVKMTAPSILKREDQRKRTCDAQGHRVATPARHKAAARMSPPPKAPTPASTAIRRRKKK